jgi:hypothetical protein
MVEYVTMKKAFFSFHVLKIEVHRYRVYFFVLIYCSFFFPTIQRMKYHLLKQCRPRAGNCVYKCNGHGSDSGTHDNKMCCRLSAEYSFSFCCSGAATYNRLSETYRTYTCFDTFNSIKNTESQTKFKKHPQFEGTVVRA